MHTSLSPYALEEKKQSSSTDTEEIIPTDEDSIVGAGISTKQMVDILVNEQYINSKHLAELQQTYKENQIAGLLEKRIITQDLLGQSVAEYLGLPYADLNTKEPTEKQMKKVPEAIAKKYRLILFHEDKKEVTFTTDHPRQPGLKDIFANIAKKKKVIIAYSLPNDIEKILIRYQKSLTDRFSSIIEQNQKIAPNILNSIIQDAIYNNTSDIHMEPRGKKEVVIRFRVDGVLKDTGILEKIYYDNLVNRVKVQSQLRIDEHSSTQDGAMRFEMNGRTVDLRISIAPTLDGEKVVIRILSQYVKQFSLADLGLSEKNKEVLAEAAKKPFGMILVTGPTGSGKTTTLYALLKSINKPEINITTIEDPVEYRLTGINQIQVNKETNITFAAGLRSIVRQDPDVILVGEIRDTETAEIAVNAALTGHLLFSTFHANDAPTSIPRLLDMGVEPFLLASTVEVIVAQRLVRKICDHCRVSINKTPAQIKSISAKSAPFFPKKTLRLYKGNGCNVCGDTGYRGRIGIFEFIQVTPRLKDLILKNPSTQDIWETARQDGATSFFEDGVQKVINGVTTLEELLRVAAPPEHKVKKTKKR